MRGGVSINEVRDARRVIRTPTRLALDSSGLVYIADLALDRIQRVEADGSLDTYAGGASSQGPNGDGLLATAARVDGPRGIAFDAAGNLYIAETNDDRIRRVEVFGRISTFAGTGDPGFFGDRGSADQAMLDSPRGVAVGVRGNVYVADTNNQRIRRVGTDGIITTFAGSGNFGFSGDGGPAIEASLANPEAVATDSRGNVYIADTSNHRIRVVNISGIITTFAGTGRDSFSGDGGPPTAADLSRPFDVAVDLQGTVYIADTFNQRVRRVGMPVQSMTPALSLSVSWLLYESTGVGEISEKTLEISNTGDGILSTEISLGGEDADQFVLSQTELRIPAGREVTVNVLFLPVSEGPKRASVSIKHNAVGSPSSIELKGTGAGIHRIETFAGTDNLGFPGFSGDGGPAIEALLNTPHAVVSDSHGNLFIADSFNDRIRKVSPDGIISTIAGTGSGGGSGDEGPATQAQLNFPGDIATDSQGVIYIADAGNHRVRRLDPEGTITTFAGSGVEGFSGDGGPATEARLDFPIGVAVDPQGFVYIVDSNNHRIRGVTPEGIITTFAGSGSAGLGNGAYSGDGGLANEARLNNPLGMGLDAQGSVYIADSGNHRIRRVNPEGVTTTFAGSGTEGYSGDGRSPVKAQLRTPRGVTIDPNGIVYIADSGNHRIRRVNLDGIMTTFAGPVGSTLEQSGDSGDGGPAAEARLNFPTSLAVDAEGLVYIADSGNHRIRVVEMEGGGLGGGGEGLSSDFDNDGDVDFDDFFAFAAAFGKEALGADARFDLDGDGEVNFDDFFEFAAAFGT